MASKICDGLYLGSQLDVENIDLELISHVLTVSSYDFSRSDKDKLSCKWIEVEDSINQDILKHFSECIEFIEEAQKDRGCFVHCVAGVSRSATVVIAYLMWKEKLSADLALQLVRSARPQASPNHSFMYQLHMFEGMGYQIDLNNAQYKLYKLTSFANTLRQAGYQQLKMEDLGCDPHGNSDVRDVSYRCRKCRRTLFHHPSLITHKVGVGKAAFDYRGSKGGNDSEELCNKSNFIEPLQWMLESIQVLEGKLYCPKCNIKLGSFNWCGERCPCGQWVTPAFHIDTGKVDKSVPMVQVSEHPIK